MLGVPAPIDAVFVDAAGVVLRVARLRPWLGFAAHPRAAAVLEVPAGAAAGVRPGDRLDILRG